MLIKRVGQCDGNKIHMKCKFPIISGSETS